MVSKGRVDDGRKQTDWEKEINAQRGLLQTVYRLNITDQNTYYYSSFVEVVV